MAEGSRLRALKRAHYLWPLTPDERAAIHRIPYWAVYGPEDGAPLAWFNEAGLLLPKYRPGGARFGDFRRWRRLVRCATVLHQRAARRWDRFMQDWGAIILMLWVAVMFIAIGWATATSDWFSANDGLRIAVPVFVGATILHFGRLVLPEYVRRFYIYCSVVPVIWKRAFAGAPLPDALSHWVDLRRITSSPAGKGESSPEDLRPDDR